MTIIYVFCDGDTGINYHFNNRKNDTKYTPHWEGRYIQLKQTDGEWIVLKNQTFVCRSMKEYSCLNFVTRYRDETELFLIKWNNRKVEQLDTLGN